MRYNDFGIDFKYLIVNDQDKNYGLTVNTVGFQPVAPHTSYPSTEHPQSYYFHPSKGRVLKEYQIVYISKGKGIFASHSQEQTNVDKGQVMILFPGQWHTYSPLSDTGWNEYYIGFEGVIIDNLLKNRFISKEDPLLTIGLNEDLVNLFSYAIQVAKADKKAAQQHLAGIVMHILGLILSISQNKNFEINNAAQIIEKAKIIMNENLTKEMDVKELASKLCTSYSWFRKVFKEYTGYPPAQYFQELKIRKAKQLLFETKMSVKEIAYELNYYSYEYFLLIFKKRTGLSPLKYRMSEKME